MSGFIAQLAAAWEKNDSLLCLGLDPEIERFPSEVLAQSAPIFEFNRGVVDATADLVCAYKLQFAHYAAYRAEEALERTIAYIHDHHPQVPVILDAKRGDVGNTAERYAAEAFERYRADAVTENPYLGGDALEPFLRHVGAQRGSVAQAVRNGQTRHGTGLIISSSRGVLYGGAAADFPGAVRAAAQALREEINASRQRA